MQIRYFADNLEKRILPTFASINREGEKVREEAWKGFKESATPDADPESAAEWAFHEGLSHYINLEDLRQGLLNMSAAFCYHLFEQQLFRFHRKELLKQHEENNHDLFNLTEVKKRLAEHAIDIKAFGEVGRRSMNSVWLPTS